MAGKKFAHAHIHMEFVLRLFFVVFLFSTSSRHSLRPPQRALYIIVLDYMIVCWLHCARRAARRESARMDKVVRYWRDIESVRS